MNRRSFLRALGIGVGAFAAAPLMQFVPTPKPVRTPSLRFIQNYNVSAGNPARMDVLYGWGTLSPSLACRVVA